MIKYRYDEEPLYLNYHFKKMEEIRAKEILDSGMLSSPDDAEYLARYFWKMVDFSISEEKAGVELPWPESREFWNEKLMNSISGYIEAEGFEESWDKVVGE
ncbi:hypothetical protein [Sessilibacter corallicola]|uniref:Uncharacterized protein n=1 Tax=Sessilibacter corallicola TaxID=2904075 RepID=A0ABQ0A9E9_9GAMM